MLGSCGSWLASRVSAPAFVSLARRVVLCLCNISSPVCVAVTLGMRCGCMRR